MKEMEILVWMSVVIVGFSSGRSILIGVFWWERKHIFLYIVAFCLDGLSGCWIG